ncbi:MAG: hypothetical protein U1D30_22210 [Planctomycetota bacterium]
MQLSPPVPVAEWVEEEQEQGVHLAAGASEPADSSRSIGNRRFLDGLPLEWKRTYEAMVEDWETPEKIARAVGPRTEAIYRSSVLLFTEVGDGYGGLIYQPEGPEVNSTGFIRTASTVPGLLTNANGRPKNYSEAIVWLIMRLAMSRYEELGPEVLLVDRRSPSAFPCGTLEW